MSDTHKDALGEAVARLRKIANVLRGMMGDYELEAQEVEAIADALEGQGGGMPQPPEEER